jgi:hypothetical protein
MIKKLLMLAVTSGLAAKALQMWIDRETERRDAARQKSDLQRWEDEGGPATPTAQAEASKPVRRRSRSAPDKTADGMNGSENASPPPRTRGRRSSAAADA